MPGIIGSYIGESYRIESELGSGGMGDVYRAVELATGDEVAIKVIKPKAIADPDRLRRFRNEAKAASSIRHPNIVAVREVGAGEIDGQMRDYIVMELVAGSTLQHRIDGRPLLLSEALHFAIQIVSALEAAHKAGVVHRDVKPANVMIDATGTAKLADFGLAKIAGPPADPFAETGSMQLDLTNDGSIIGSVSYMSPEQARGLDVDFRSDIFSFGAVLYEMLSGKPAFDGATRADRFTAVLTSDPVDIPNLPPDLSVILMRCLRKDSTRRWQSASELRAALEDLRHDIANGGTAANSAGNTKWTRRLVLAAAGGAAVGFLPAYYLGSRRKEQPAFQRLTFRSGDITGAKFAPGDLIAFSAAWDGGPSSLYTCQPGNREPRALGLPGNRLKGVTSAGQAALLGDDAQSTLSIVSLGGGEPRPKLTEVIDACWAPDGENLARSGRLRVCAFRPPAANWHSSSLFLKPPTTRS
jgi:eukaryotic-like serine/threonine-protein kinase